MRKVLFFTLISTLVLVGCNKPTVDTTNKETFHNSTNKIVEEITNEQTKKQFQEAIMFFAMGGNTSDEPNLFALSRTEENIKCLNGLNYEQIIEKYEKRQNEIKIANERRNNLRDSKKYIENILNNYDYSKATSEIAKIALKYDLKQEELKEFENLITVAKLKERRMNLTNAKDEINIALANYDFQQAENKLKEIEEKLALNNLEKDELLTIINKRKKFASYVSQLEFYDFYGERVSNMFSGERAGIHFNVKNNGDENIIKLVVTVFYKDANGNVLHDEDFVFVNKDSWDSDTKKILKANQVKEMPENIFFTTKEKLSNWETDNTELIIKEIEFENNDYSGNYEFDKSKLTPIKALAKNAEKKSCIEKISIYGAEAKRINTFLEGEKLGIRCNLKNNSNKTLNKVEVTAYFKNKSGEIIFEERWLPVLVSQYNFIGNNEPLKPNRIYEMKIGNYHCLDGELRDAVLNKTEFKVTDVEFGKQKLVENDTKEPSVINKTEQQIQFKRFQEAISNIETIEKSISDAELCQADKFEMRSKVESKWKLLMKEMLSYLKNNLTKEDYSVINAEQEIYLKVAEAKANETAQEWRGGSGEGLAVITVYNELWAKRCKSLLENIKRYVINKEKPSKPSF